jgi:hypothetical protein
MPAAMQRFGPTVLEAFSHSAYLLVRPLFSWRRIILVHTPDGSVAACAEHPWFRLRDELVLYGDEEMTQPILVIKNRRIAAINMEHDLFDAQTGARLGVVRDQGLRSLLRDTWDILDADERTAWQMVEEGPWLLRRILRMLPGRHRIELGGQHVATLQQHFSFFRREFALTLHDVPDPIEPRFAIACALIALLADLRRESSR